MSVRLVTEASVLDKPITEAEFASLVQPLGPYGPDDVKTPLAVAVSGGADSMALAFLLKRWRQHVKALVVDHALRPESAGEAYQTCERLKGMGIEAQLMRLPRLPPGCVQAKAREARFSVLEQACYVLGASVLFVAHHQADQEETVWMRYERGSGVTGLGGMARKSVRGRIMLLRPLLETRPERLRATLRHAGHEWCEDPSNRNRRFRRVQIRQDMNDAERILMQSVAKDSQEKQKEQEAALAVRLAENVQWQEEGWVILQPGAFKGDEAECDQLLSALMRLIGGQDYPPERARITALRRRGHGSLSGACLVKKALSWWIVRERRGLEKPVLARFAQRWDGRWRYYGLESASSEKKLCHVAALGCSARSLRVGRNVPAMVLETLPGLWCGEKLCGVPEGVRDICKDVPRCAFIWDAGVPLTGGRLVT